MIWGGERGKAFRKEEERKIINVMKTWDRQESTVPTSLEEKDTEWKTNSSETPALSAGTMSRDCHSDYQLFRGNLGRLLYYVEKGIFHLKTERAGYARGGEDVAGL